MSTTPHTILVVGATGQQGSSVLTELSHLLSSTTSSSPLKPKILALTRTASSPKALALPSQYPNLSLTVIEGDTRLPAPIFAAHPEIDAVFSYTTPPDEEPQARALIDAAAAHAKNVLAGPLHFVFSSVDRGGEPESWDEETEIPHFAQKCRVEVHLRDVARASRGRLVFTVLRPAAFMDNLNPGTFGMVFASLWNTLPPSRKLQLVSVRDIGLFAAKALILPTSYHHNTAIGLAGDELTYDEAREIYYRVAQEQEELPQAWWVVGWVVRRLFAARDVGAMFSWFEKKGYGVDIVALRMEEPQLQDFETWLKESSKFKLDEL